MDSKNKSKKQQQKQKKPKKLQLLSFKNYFFAITFISSILPNVFAMKAVEETFRQLIRNVWCLWPKQNFAYIDETFAIN